MAGSVIGLCMISLSLNDNHPLLAVVQLGDVGFCNRSITHISNASMNGKNLAESRIQVPRSTGQACSSATFFRSADSDSICSLSSVWAWRVRSTLRKTAGHSEKSSLFRSLLLLVNIKWERDRNNVLLERFISTSNKYPWMERVFDKKEYAARG